MASTVSSGSSAAVFSEATAFNISGPNDGFVVGNIGNVTREEAEVWKAWEILNRPNQVSAESVPDWDAHDPLQNVSLLQFHHNRSDTTSTSNGTTTSGNQSSSTCQLVLARDRFRPRPYQETRAATFANAHAIRFGAPNDMIYLLDASEGQQDSYIKGLVATSFVVAVIFVFWTLFMLVFKEFCGYRWVGFLSGRFIRPTMQQQTCQLNANEDTDADADADADVGEASKHEDSDDSHYKDETLRKELLSSNEDEEQHNFLNDQGRTVILMAVASAPNEDDNESSNKHDATMPPPERPLSHGDDDDGEDRREHAHDDDEGNNNKETWLDACHRQKRRARRVRLTLAFLCICNVYAAVFFCALGTRYVSQTVSDTAESLHRLQDLCIVGSQWVDQFVSRHNSTQTQAQSVLHQMNNQQDTNRTCRRQDDDTGGDSSTSTTATLCDSIAPIAQQCSFDTFLPTNLTAKLEPVVEFVNSDLSALSERLSGLSNHLQVLQDDMAVFSKANDDLDWLFWVSYAFTAVLGLCSLGMILSVYRAHSHDEPPNEESMAALQQQQQQQQTMEKWRRCGYGTCSMPARCYHSVSTQFRHRFLIPLFSILVLFAFAFSVAFIITSVAASDWCTPSPNTQVMYVLNETIGGGDSGTETDTLLLDFLLYYIDTCPPNASPREVLFDAYSTELSAGLSRISSFRTEVQNFLSVTSIVSQGLEQYNMTCSQDSMSRWSLYAEELEEMYCLLIGQLEDLSRFFWCRHWSPMYVHFMFDGICYNAEDGLVAVAATMTAIVLFSCIILTLRAGVYDTLDEQDYLHQRGPLQLLMGWLCCCRRRGNSETSNVAVQPTKTMELERSEEEQEEAEAEGDLIS